MTLQQQLAAQQAENEKLKTEALELKQACGLSKDFECSHAEIVSTIRSQLFETADLACRHPRICLDHEGECGWCRSIADQRAEIDTLKTILAKLSIPCIYCGLEDMSKCERGFPGCAKADDLICGDEEYFKHQQATMQGLVAALTFGIRDGELHTFESRQRFRAQARAALAALKKVEDEK